MGSIKRGRGQLLLFLPFVAFFIVEFLEKRPFWSWTHLLTGQKDKVTKEKRTKRKLEKRTKGQNDKRTELQRNRRTKIYFLKDDGTKVHKDLR